MAGDFRVRKRPIIADSGDDAEGTEEKSLKVQKQGKPEEHHEGTEQLKRWNMHELAHIKASLHKNMNRKDPNGRKNFESLLKICNDDRDARTPPIYPLQLVRKIRDVRERENAKESTEGHTNNSGQKRNDTGRQSGTMTRASVAPTDRRTPLNTPAPSSSTASAYRKGTKSLLAASSTTSGGGGDSPDFRTYSALLDELAMLRVAKNNLEKEKQILARANSVQAQELVDLKKHLQEADENVKQEKASAEKGNLNVKSRLKAVEEQLSVAETTLQNLRQCNRELRRELFDLVMAVDFEETGKTELKGKLMGILSKCVLG